MRYRRAWIALLILAALTPLGLIAAGGSWGEWEPNGLKERVGYVPQGIAETDKRAKSPFDGYEIPGLRRSRAARTAGCTIAALAGAGATAGLVFLLGKGAGHGRIS